MDEERGIGGGRVFLPYDTTRPRLSWEAVCRLADQCICSLTPERDGDLFQMRAALEDFPKFRHPADCAEFVRRMDAGPAARVISELQMVFAQ